MSRLKTALSQDLLTLPQAGAIAVLRPPAGYDLPLPQARVRIVHGFRPDVDFWQARGLPVSREMPAASVALVVVPRAKALARDLVARAARAASDLVIVDGQKTDGVDSLFRDCRRVLGDLPTVTKAHGRLFWLAPSSAFADWAAKPSAPGPEGFFTAAGIYSAAAVDRGSALLAGALPDRLPGRVADLGAGWGYLSRAILAREGVTHLDLIEAEALALDCARLNVTDPRAAFHWADATQFAPAEPYEAVVTNPPFHQSRAADPSLGRAFIQAAARMLTPQGALWLVANRHLPYEGELRGAFARVEEVGGDAAFKIFHAARPIR